MAIPVIPLLVTNARRRIVAAFEARHATAADRAIAFTPGTRRVERKLFAQMLRFGALVEAEPGHYWMDAKRVEDFRKETLAHVLGVVGIAGLAAAAALALGR